MTLSPDQAPVAMLPIASNDVSLGMKYLPNTLERRTYALTELQIRNMRDMVVRETVAALAIDPKSDLRDMFLKINSVWGGILSAVYIGITTTKGKTYILSDRRNPQGAAVFYSVKKAETWLENRPNLKATIFTRLPEKFTLIAIEGLNRLEGIQNE